MADDHKKRVMFTKAAAMRVAAAVKRVEYSPRDLTGQTQRTRSYSGGSDIVYAQAPSGGIPARVGTQAGEADCELFHLNETGVLTSSGITTRVWNIFGSVVGAGSKYLVVGEMSQGWGVVSEDCS